VAHDFGLGSRRHGRVTGVAQFMNVLVQMLFLAHVMQNTRHVGKRAGMHDEVQSRVQSSPTPACHHGWPCQVHTRGLSSRPACMSIRNRHGVRLMRTPQSSRSLSPFLLCFIRDGAPRTTYVSYFLILNPPLPAHLHLATSTSSLRSTYRPKLVRRAE
jgi:hypothetical protein